MAFIANTRPVPFGAVSTLRVVNFVSNTAATVALHFKAAKTRKVLANLSNRQLDDIGVLPGEIARISHRVTLLH